MPRIDRIDPRPTRLSDRTPFKDRDRPLNEVKTLVPGEVPADYDLAADKFRLGPSPPLRDEHGLRAILEKRQEKVPGSWLEKMISDPERILFQGPPKNVPPPYKKNYPEKKFGSCPDQLWRTEFCAYLYPDTVAPGAELWPPLCIRRRWPEGAAIKYTLLVTIHKPDLNADYTPKTPLIGAETYGHRFLSELPWNESWPFHDGFEWDQMDKTDPEEPGLNWACASWEHVNLDNMLYAQSYHLWLECQPIWSTYTVCWMDYPEKYKKTFYVCKVNREHKPRCNLSDNETEAWNWHHDAESNVTKVYGKRVGERDIRVPMYKFKLPDPRTDQTSQQTNQLEQTIQYADLGQLMQ